MIVNGSRGQTIIPSRGLRKGDPLSPFLFLLCAEGLSSLIRLTEEENTLKGVKASQRGPAISHLLFADDCILFAEASERGAQSLKQILQEYKINSGQCLNYEKSTIFFSTNTEEGVRGDVTMILRVRRANDIKRYLGLPSLVGKQKKSSFQSLKDRLKGLTIGVLRFSPKGGKKCLSKRFYKPFQLIQ